MRERKTLWVLKKMIGREKPSYLKRRYKERNAAPPDDPEYPLEFTEVTDEAHIFQEYDAAYVFRVLAHLDFFDPVGVSIIAGDYER